MKEGSRTLVALGAALALGTGYWVWAVKIQPRRAQEAEDAKLLFKGLNPAGTSEILLRKAGYPDVLLRKVQGQWRLVTPVAAPADPAAVGGILTQLEQAKRGEVVSGPGTTLRDFGLDHPRGAVTFSPDTPGAKAQVLYFGIDSPLGGQTYAEVEGRPGVFLTDLYVKDAILKDAGQLRDKTVWSFQRDDVVSVRSGISGFTLERNKDGFWRVVAGARNEPAKPDQVQQWLDVLSSLRADSVPSETGRGKFGLKARARSLTVTLKGGQEMVLREGSEAKPGPGFYVQVAGQGPVYQLPEYQKAQIEKKADGLMDLDAFGFDTSSVGRFTVARPGRKTLTAVRADGVWGWVPAAPPKPGVRAFDFPGFLASLAHTQVLGRLPDADRPAHPVATVTLYGDTGGVLETVEFGTRRGPGQVATSATKHQVVVVPVNLLDGLPQHAPSATPALTPTAAR